MNLRRTKMMMSPSSLRLSSEVVIFIIVAGERVIGFLDRLR